MKRLAAWAALAVGWMLPSTGCQVEYAGMTLPSGKYMHDDVQYFAPGPDFPWANSQAATQRARMQAMGIEVPPPGQAGPFTPPVAGGAQPGVQNQLGRPTDLNQGPMSVEPPLPAPGAVTPPPPQPAPGAETPPAPGPAPAPAPAPGAVPPPPPGG
jgi:hypothetical protein